MAWDEVKKVNSNFTNEPLNFNNYINDISTFGTYSYVLDVENSDLWHDLIKNSLTLFGHDSIHNTVLNRFTDADVDLLISGNGRLGQAFNSFYSTDKFVSGNINNVLASLTIEAYNKLDDKFKNGINRYVSEHTESNVGAWLSSVFDISVTYSTIDELLADTTFWNTTVVNNEGLRITICMSISSAEYMAEHTTSTIYASFIETVSNSLDATMDLINTLDGSGTLSTFFDNETVMETIADSETGMKAICYNLAGFSAMISSTTAMNIVASSETACDVIVGAIEEVANSETKLLSVKDHLTSINSDISTIAMGDTVVDDIADTKANIESCVAKIQTVTSKADILAENVDALVDNENAMKILLNNKTSANSILSSTFGSSMFANEKYMEYISLASASLYVICLSATLQNRFRASAYMQTFLTNMHNTMLADTGNWKYINTQYNLGIAKTYNHCKLVVNNNTISGQTGSANLYTDTHDKYWLFAQVYKASSSYQAVVSVSTSKAVSRTTSVDKNFVFLGYNDVISYDSGNTTMFSAYDRSGIGGVYGAFVPIEQGVA